MIQSSHTAIISSCGWDAMFILTMKLSLLLTHFDTAFNTVMAIDKKQPVQSFPIVIRGQGYNSEIKKMWTGSSNSMQENGWSVDKTVQLIITSTVV